MPPPTSSRALPIAALVLGGLTVIAGCVPGAIAVGLARAGDGQWRDATPSEVSPPSRVASGEAVWLRGMRDTSNPITLPDGRVLYPTLDEPGVMVDCAGTGCVGTLRGAIEDLEVLEPLPTGWPARQGRSVRVLVVGEVGDAARDKVTLAAAGAVGLIAVGFFACVGGALVLIRRRHN